MESVIKCVTVGDSAVGKTTMLTSYTKDSFPEGYVPTAFDVYSTTIMAQRNTISLELWDTAGQDEYQMLRSTSYKDAKLILLTFSTVDPNSFRNIPTKWYQEIRQHCPDIPIILVGTKQDLRCNKDIVEALGKADQSPVSYSEGLYMSLKIGAVDYRECSSLTRKGLDSVFEKAAEIVLKKQSVQKQPPRHCKTTCTIL